jgi:hypothetical protein
VLRFWLYLGKGIGMYRTVAAVVLSRCRLVPEDVWRYDKITRGETGDDEMQRL